MPVYTDSPASAVALLAEDIADGFAPCPVLPAEHAPLARAVLGDVAPLHSASLRSGGWNLVLARDIADGSQYDTLIELSRAGLAIPDCTALLARTGTGFHGFRQRDWSAGTGNIHLTVHFAPDCAIERFDTVFAALAAVSVVDAVDEVPGLHGMANIKWVNDVLVEGRKVAGVLAYTQTRGVTVTTAVLGVGVNVELAPAVTRSPFVPAAGSLRDIAPDAERVRVSAVLHSLLSALHRNYNVLLRDGHGPVMDRYRQRSAVIGRDVTICAEDRPGQAPSEPEVLASGRVESIGDGLELYLAGQSWPVTGGRLIFGNREDSK